MADVEILGVFKLDATFADPIIKGLDEKLKGIGTSFRQLNEAGEHFMAGLGVNLTALKNPAEALGEFMKESIDAAIEEQQVMAQTEAVIKSTGGAAGFTGEEIKGMAEHLASVSTFGHDAIQSMENLLLTFPKIKGDTFKETSSAVLDLATAMHEDLRSAAIQVGKALQDPVAGITALRRVGVNFSADQKDVIKQLVATGHAAQAQQIILHELNTEFGGSAAAQAQTYAGKLEIMKDRWEQLQETVGNKVIPILTNVVEHLTDVISVGSKTNDELIKMAGSSDLFTKGLANAEIVGNGFNRLMTLASANTDKMKQSLFDGKMGLDDYNRGIQGVYEGIKAWVDQTFAASPILKAQYDQMIDQASAANQLTQEQANLQAAQSVVVSDMNDRHIPALKAAAGSTEALAAAEAADVETKKQLQEAQKATSEAIQGFNFLISGPVVTAYNKYKDEQDKLNEKLGQFEYTAQHSYGAAKTAALDGIETTRGELTKLGESYDQATKKVLFDMAAQQLSHMDLGATGIAALGKLGEQWGLFDKQTATAMASTAANLQKLGEDKNIDAFVNSEDMLLAKTKEISADPSLGEFKTTVDNTTKPAGDDFDSLKGHAHDAQIEIDKMHGKTITITTIYKDIHQSSGEASPGGQSGANKKIDAGAATGASFIVPPGYSEAAGRPFRLGLSSGEFVNVNPKGLDSAEKGSTKNFQLVINSSAPVENLNDQYLFLNSWAGVRP